MVVNKVKHGRINSKTKNSAIGASEIQKACQKMIDKLEKNTSHMVSFDIGNFNGKAYMSVQNLSDKKSKGVFLKLVSGKDDATVMLAKGSTKKLKEAIKKSPKNIGKSIDKMKAALRKASVDEAKSLTDF